MLPPMLNWIFSSKSSVVVLRMSMGSVGLSILLVFTPSVRSTAPCTFSLMRSFPKMGLSNLSRNWISDTRLLKSYLSPNLTCWRLYSYTDIFERASINCCNVWV